MMKIKALTAIALTAVATIGAGVGVASTAGTEVLAENNANHMISLVLNSSNITMNGDNLVLRTGMGDLTFNVTGMTSIKDSKIYLENGAVIKNVTKMQNIKDITINGFIGEKEIDNENDKIAPFKLGYGYDVNGERTIVMNNLNFNKNYVLYDINPSYFELKAVRDNISIENLTINYWCHTTDSAHANMPDKFNEKSVSVKGTCKVYNQEGKLVQTDWDNGVKIYRNKDNYTEYYAKLVLKTGEEFKIYSSDEYGKLNGDKWSDKDSFEACANNSANDITYKDDGNIHANNDCTVEIYWKGGNTQSYMTIVK